MSALPSCSDTIAALSTALPGAWSALVRLSGERAIDIARGLDLPSGASSTLIPAPRTYTRQDMAEIEVPAAGPLVHEVLQQCVASGARIAQPGEFTFRAFRNGRIDLAQAEAVLALVSAASGEEFQSALEGLGGGLSRAAGEIRDRILDLSAGIEAAIDFEIDEFDTKDVQQALGDIARLVRKALTEAAGSETSADRPVVFLYGPANAGKSTLFNLLVPGADSIVSPAAGTTRDVLYGEASLDGLSCPVRFADSAGVFERPQGLDAEALERAGTFRKGADLVVLVSDATRPEASRALLEGLAGTPHLVVTNKIDLAPAEGSSSRTPRGEGLAVSARTGQGVDLLKRAIARKLAGLAAGEARFRAGARQREAWVRTLQLLDEARQAPGPEFAAADLRQAAEQVSSISGLDATDEILSRVFSRFCIGK